MNGAVLPPGKYTYPFQYQLPEGIPGSFMEKIPLNHHDEELIDNDGVSDAVFYDSDDEAGGYRRSSLLAIVMYKLKVTFDVNGLFTAVTGIEDMNCKVRHDRKHLPLITPLVDTTDIGSKRPAPLPVATMSGGGSSNSDRQCSQLLLCSPLAGSSRHPPEAGDQPPAGSFGARAGRGGVLLLQQGQVQGLGAIRQARVRRRRDGRRAMRYRERVHVRPQDARHPPSLPEAEIFEGWP
jgi:hypothetical protein